jgi:hypothetical protein
MECGGGRGREAHSGGTRLPAGPSHQVKTDSIFAFRARKSTGLVRWSSKAGVTAPPDVALPPEPAQGDPPQPVPPLHGPHDVQAAAVRQVQVADQEVEPLPLGQASASPTVRAARTT